MRCVMIRFRVHSPTISVSSNGRFKEGAAKREVRLKKRRRIEFAASGECSINFRGVSPATKLSEQIRSN